MKQREIKFRAWDGEKMWYGGEIYSKSKDGNRSYPCEITSRGIEFVSPYDSKHSDIIIDEQGREGYQDWDKEKTNRDCEVMQFTGLKDKNGVDIYENMILNKTFVIKYLKYRYVLFYISNMSKFEEIFNYENEFEITGEYSEI